ncbi:hypothetical protein [Propionibacterium acidifaciens]|uniref:hypothetical protein n=1 Tax=Propionibacterium acidifaciens TaxID=556499 RepID=UPI00186923FC|nr:hypothetical protein [Propionibacterium acidifaciens]
MLPADRALDGPAEDDLPVLLEVVVAHVEPLRRPVEERLLVVGCELLAVIGLERRQCDARTGCHTLSAVHAAIIPA